MKTPRPRRRRPLFTANSVFTDDTVLTIAVADGLLSQRGYRDVLQEYFHRYPRAGYGGTFIRWASTRETQPYQSWGNGSAMRVSGVAYAFDSIDEVLAEARLSAEATHNHPEGVRGAQATAAAVFLARTGRSKRQIRQFIEQHFGYNLSQSLDEIRPGYLFDVSCQGSVPQSIIAFLESNGFEDALRNAISLGGDADTMACIAGAIAEAFYGGVPENIETPCRAALDEPLRDILHRFHERYGKPSQARRHGTKFFGLLRRKAQ